MLPAAVSAWRYQLLIGLAVLASYGLVYPVGEYAVLDDWAYALSLWHLQHDGELRIGDWNPMSLIGHLFWGLLFTKTFGFSLTMTKVAVVALHLIECLALFRLLTLCAVPAAAALGAVAVLIVQPLHFPHCYMNMTDIPLLAWQLVALLFYVQGLTAPQPRNWLWLVLGSLASGYAYLIRQSGCLVPGALLVYLVLYNRKRITPTLFAAAFGPAALIGVFFELWYRTIHGPTAAFRDSTALIGEFLASPPFSAIPYIALTLLMQIGMFVAPLALALPATEYRLPRGRYRSTAIGLCLVAIALWAWYALVDDRVFPYIRNVVTPYGISRPNEYVVGDLPQLWGRGVGWTVSLLGLAGLLVFACRLWTETSPNIATPAVVLRRLSTVLFGVQLSYLFITAPILFDRHFLMLLPTGLILFCLSGRGELRLVSSRLALCLAPLAFYSVTTTHDLHALSRVSWQAGEALLKRGVSPYVINAGYAFDCWQSYDARKKDVVNLPIPIWWKDNEWTSLMQVERRINAVVNARQNYWWVGYLKRYVPTQFVVSTVPPTTANDRLVFNTIDKYPYSRWWPWGTWYVYVLEWKERADDTRAPP